MLSLNMQCSSDLRHRIVSSCCGYVRPGVRASVVGDSNLACEFACCHRLLLAQAHVQLRVEQLQCGKEQGGGMTSSLSQIKRLAPQLSNIALTLRRVHSGDSAIRYVGVILGLHNTSQVYTTVLRSAGHQRKLSSRCCTACCTTVGTFYWCCLEHTMYLYIRLRALHRCSEQTKQGHSSGPLQHAAIASPVQVPDM